MRIMSPRVSIVLPTYNGSRYLAQSVDSCLSQTERDIELILVDDGSDRKTKEIIASISDPRVVRVTHVVNQGLPAALNTGFAKAKGEFLTWTSDDNLYAPDALMILLKFLNACPSVDFVYTSHYWINELGKIIGQRVAQKPSHLETGEGCSVGGCFMYRRRVYEALGEYDTKAFLAEDYQYWLRIYRSFKMGSLSEIFPYYYRVHPNALSSKRAFEARRTHHRVRYQMGMLPLNKYIYELSRTDIDEAFVLHSSGEFGRARKKMIAGVMKFPLWLSNRGVLAVILKFYQSHP